MRHWNWTLETKKGGLEYARRGFRINGVKSSVYMHRALITVDAGFVIDHIDGNGLNNRKSNLRICTHTENLQNSKTLVNPLGKGVYCSRSGKRYYSYICVNKKRIYLGSFLTKEEAKLAYDQAAFEHFGEFANTGNKEFMAKQEKSR